MYRIFTYSEVLWKKINLRRVRKVSIVYTQFKISFLWKRKDFKQHIMNFSSPQKIIDV